MPTVRQPRSGSLQFWPRKRAKRAYARIRNFPWQDKATPVGFAGYKVGMTHVIAVENRKTSPNKGNNVVFPVTIVECPPIKIASVRFYKKTEYGIKLVAEVPNKVDKELSRKIILSKKKSTPDFEKIKPESYDDIRIVVYTQPKLTSLGKKKPEIFEMGLGGTKEQKLGFAKGHLDKEILIKDVFQEGEQIDVHGITKGKGFQGPVKRFGISLRQHKSEKSIRNPGSLGPWCGQGHVMWRVAHAGKMGFHQRTHYNKYIIKISDEINEVSQEGGFLKHGPIKNTYLLIKGSVPGHKNRLAILTKAIRPNHKLPKEAPALEYISKKSKQGR